MSDQKPERVYCPVCLQRFKFAPSWKAGDIVICPICGQRLKLEQTDQGWVGSRPEKGMEREIRERSDEFARIRGYKFNEMKEDVLEGLFGKNQRFGDFYCPCRMMHVPQYQCPCEPTRRGDVEANGKCYCGFFWRKDKGTIDPPPRP
jgi:ferredoxin-thioredoxin reductase catalytic subunit